ncbi:hypothetical protein PIB30_004958 [Stylosanthes scabra]|uniref:RNase H type-1 domain-containing protein n=1 Tax=Stylosanthes scabra TaxID=79078 RepID=A0ABU6X2Y8_9FABA|nr:hypothetical protein [Stylosanthes scabra]
MLLFSCIILHLNSSAYIRVDKDLFDKLFELHLRSWEVHFEHVNCDFNKAINLLAKWGAKDHKEYVEWLEPAQELHLVLVSDLA